MLLKIFFSFLTIIPLLQAQEKDSASVYIVKQRWHTGIIIKTSEISRGYLPQITGNFHSAYVDIGWGDNDFYREPGFDLGLALKALFYPTESVLRVEGFNMSSEKYISLADRGAKIKLDRKSFNALCVYITNSFRLKSGSEIIVEKRGGGSILYFAAEGKYNLFNTCNTWAAKGLEKAGLKISTKLILAEELFNELADSPDAIILK